MKTNNKKDLRFFSFLICFTLLFFSCAKDEAPDIESNEPIGEISITTKALRDGGNDLLGYGYDCRYALADNVSSRGYTTPVIDLKRYNGRIDTGLPLDVAYSEVTGSTYTEFERNLSASLSSLLSADNLGFVKWGVIQLSSEYDSKINQKTNYSFSKVELFVNKKNLKLPSTNASDYKSFLSDDFKKAIANKSAKHLIESFGTHVLADIVLGAKISILISANTSRSSQAEFTQFSTDIKSLFKAGGKDSIVKIKNLSDVNVSIKISNGPYVPNVDAKINADGTVTGVNFDWTKWSNEVTANNSGLLYSPLNRLIPIWDFIDDQAFKKEVKNEILYRTQANPVPNLIEMKWNDVLYVNNNKVTNGGYEFVSYQWFANDVLLDGDYYGQAISLTVGTSKLPFNIPYYFVGLTKDGRIIKSTTVIPKG